MTRALAWALVCVVMPSALRAQRHVPAALGPANRLCAPITVLSCHPVPEVEGPPVFTTQAPETSAWPILASALLPGTGQAFLGSSRAFAYLAVEAFAMTSWVKHSVDYRNRRNGYRDLAARVARAPYATVRPNGDFAYYERMSHYAESGRYDLVAGGGLDPETDTTTYNGAMWLLARRTYWTDPHASPATDSPEWARAITFYRSRAYDQTYRWSWSGAPQEFAMFLGLIDRSNEANRRAMQDLGLLLANHLLSTVDAYITVRLARHSGEAGFALTGSVPLYRFTLSRTR